jgi:branched-chain amino acid transport system permease protein
VTAVPAGHFQTDYRGDIVIRKTGFQRWRLVVLMVALVVIPMLLSSYWLNVATAIAIAVPGALALSLLTGVAGQISLGNAAFMGIGATTAAVLGTELSWPFLVVVPVAGLLTGFIGTIVGIPSLRVRGLYLIIATLALHFVMVYAFRRVQGGLVGEAGFVMPIASIGGFSFIDPLAWYYLLVGFAVLVTFMHVNIVRSRVGRAWFAIRERDIAAEILGVPVAMYKIKAFTFTSAIIGVQGALYAYYIGVVNYDSFTLNLALSYVAMVMIGGLGKHVGAIYGAVFVTALPYLLTRLFEQLPSGIASHFERFTFELQAGIYGLLIILFMLFEPRGIAEITRRVRQYFVLWPFSRERLAEEEA